MENDLRGDIFRELVRAAESLTPTELGDRLGTQRQQIKYHLDKLVNQGLIIRDDGEYYCQPVFIDESFQEQFDEFLAELVPAVEQRIYIEPEMVDSGNVIAFNCLRMAVAMTLLDEHPSDADRGER